MGAAYADTVRATGGNAVFDWRVVGGALPAGLSLEPGGVLSGIPTVSGPFRFTAIATSDGLSAQREFELTEFEAPKKIRWAERSKNAVTAPEGGYDLEPAGEGQTRVSIYNVLEGHGFGKLIAGFALRSARKGADDFARSIKQAVERETPAAG